MDVDTTPEVMPLTDAEADECLSLLGGSKALLAVSGGPDSTAMMGLAAGWAARHGASVHVAVVDHGLREGSAGEAAFVAAEAARLSLPYAVLRWTGPKPKTGLPAAARAARYRLLVAHADNIGADAIVTAHTLDDQAETLLIRLAAGSGPAGMAGMRPRSVTQGMTHFRPFLGIAKGRLIATCRHNGWRWIEDPSNRNEAFARARWRALMPQLAREGLTAERLGVFARRQAENDLAMQRMTALVLRCARLERSGESWTINADLLLTEPDALVVRALGSIFQDDLPSPDEPVNAGNATSVLGPRLCRIEAFAGAMRAARQDGRVLTRTLGGQVLSLKRDGQLVGRPEPLRRRGCVNPVRTASLGNRRPEN